MSRSFFGMLRVVALTLLWAAVAVILLVVGLLTTAVKILTPDRLTPLVEHVASSYLVADVKSSKIELTFWSTFPRLTVEADSLSVVSRSLKPLTAAEIASLPSGADTLMLVNRFSGCIDIAQLPLGRLALYDVLIDGPMLNLVSVNDSVSNFNIVPPSEPDSVSAPFIVPDISINRFEIDNAGPLRYTSMADSLAVELNLTRAKLGGMAAPAYDISLGGDIKTPILGDYNFKNVSVGLDGKIMWSKKSPRNVGLVGFTIGVDSINAKLDAQLDFSDLFTITGLGLEIEPFGVRRLLDHLPSEYRRYVSPLRTDMTIAVRAQLTEPYCLTDSLQLPSLSACVRIPDCHIDYGKARIKRFGLDFDVDFDGLDPDDTRVDVKRFLIEGPATSISFSGTVGYLLNDPAVDLKLKADMVLDRLPGELRRLIPASITGSLHADLTVKGRKSYLSRDGFHRLLIDGQLSGRDLDVVVPESELSAWLGNVTIDFGTSKSFINGGNRVDSLLTASVKIDTASINADGLAVSVSRLAAGVGSSNRRNSADTTLINPFGGALSLHRLDIFSEADSSRLRLRDFTCGASLQRYEGAARVPQLNLSISAKRISAGDPTSRYVLRESNIDVTAHLKPKKRMGAKTQHIYDSIAAAHPELAADSVYSLARVERRRQRMSASSDTVVGEVVEFGLDNKMKELLRRWGVHGVIKAKRGRVFTPYFPLRNRLSNVDITFSTDSLVLRDVRYEVGQSDFLINGTVSNLRRALTSRRHQPIVVDFDMRSDTININEIVQAVFAGGAYADRVANHRPVAALADSDDDLALEKAFDSDNDTITGPFLVPRNVKANLKVRARNIIYADMLLRRFRGDIEVYDGAVNLDRLSARTELGSIDLSALYSAPDKQRMEFGFGMRVKDFHIDRFLAMFPSIDTIMPMLSDISGVINADIAATSNVDTLMNLEIPTLRAAIKIEGDSLVLLDAETFRTLSKWLFFKDKKHNMINHMSVEAVVENSQLELFPFMFDIDRYRLGVMGHNDLALNYDYHISVLKSPLPFKFGINLRGTPDNMKIRMGGAKFKEKMVVERKQIVDTTRVNLIKQMSNVFRRGVTAARLGRLDLSGRGASVSADLPSDTLSASDSLMLIKEGLMEAPVPAIQPSGDKTPVKKQDKRKNREK